jgi:hypothetical protein
MTATGHSPHSDSDGPDRTGPTIEVMIFPRRTRSVLAGRALTRWSPAVGWAVRRERGRYVGGGEVHDRPRCRPAGHRLRRPHRHSVDRRDPSRCLTEVASVRGGLHAGHRSASRPRAGRDGVPLSRGGRLGLEMVVQDLSRRGKVTSRRTRRSAAAMGMATSAPMMPRRVPPTRTATTVTTPGTWTALPMIRGTSR